MTQEAKDTLASLLRDYGFSVVVACACLYVGRQDIIVPMVAAHTTFLKDVAETQHEISKAVAEQTKLLYAMQQHHEQVRAAQEK